MCPFSDSRRPDRPADHARRAFTLIEVLVVLLVIGVLVALLIPAVQAAREASRRSQCVNNLRQFGVALQGHVAQDGAFPKGQLDYGLSLHVKMLPYLEQKALYDSINLACGASSGSTPENTTAEWTTVAVFLCPSDSGPPPLGLGPAWTNYAGSTGYGYQKYGNNGIFAANPMESVDGAPPVRPQQVKDGASATALMSEWLLGDPRTRDRRRTTFETGELKQPDQFDEFARSCHELDVRSARVGPFNKGMLWSFGYLGYTLYNHTLNINDRSCLNGGWFEQGALTAGSLHARGANTLFADGRVQFDRDSIDLGVWRALGTRDGKEVISDTSY